MRARAPKNIWFSWVFSATGLVQLRQTCHTPLSCQLKKAIISANNVDFCSFISFRSSKPPPNLPRLWTTSEKKILFIRWTCDNGSRPEPWLRHPRINDGDTNVYGQGITWFSQRIGFSGLDWILPQPTIESLGYGRSRSRKAERSHYCKKIC